eukprot:TCONS_00009382-protein
MIRGTVFLAFCMVVAFCNASLRDHQEDHYHSYYKKREILEIPQLGDANPLINLQNEAAQRDYFFHNLVKANDFNTTVFKIQMERERVIISDPIAIRSMYPVKNIIKSTGGTSIEYNDLISGGYIPSFMDNGKSHNTKKARQYQLLKNRLETYGLHSTFKDIQSYLKEIEVDSENTPIDIANQIAKISQDAMTKLLLGKRINNFDLFTNWFGSSLKVIKELDPTYGSKDELYQELYTQMLAYIQSTPVAKQLEDTEDKVNLENELMFFTIWLAAGGVQFSFRSALKYWAELEEEEREDLEAEIEKFMDKYNHENHFVHNLNRKLPLLTKFVMEVIRLEPAAAVIRGQARRDFIVTTSNGRYQIKQGTYLQADVVSAQRNPIKFKDADEVKLDRHSKNVKKYFYTFGGPYRQRATKTNHKCLGQTLAIDFIKMFLIHTTQCDVEIDSIQTSTSKTGGHDIKVTKFKC